MYSRRKYKWCSLKAKQLWCHPIIHFTVLQCNIWFLSIAPGIFFCLIFGTISLLLFFLQNSDNYWDSFKRNNYKKGNTEKNPGIGVHNRYNIGKCRYKLTAYQKWFGILGAPLMRLYLGSLGVIFLGWQHLIDIQFKWKWIKSNEE